MPIDEHRFRQTMGRFPSGVTVITTKYQNQLYGITVSSFSSLSLRPPLVLICIDTAVASHDAIAGAGFFAVNMLARNQEHLSRRFATRDIDKFQGVAWHVGLHDLPLLDGALATIECRMHSQLPGGDHSIFVGEVMDAQVYDGLPLLYYRGGYHEFQ